MSNDQATPTVEDPDARAQDNARDRVVDASDPTAMFERSLTDLIHDILDGEEELGEHDATRAPRAASAPSLPSAAGIPRDADSAPSVDELARRVGDAHASDSGIDWDAWTGMHDAVENHNEAPSQRERLGNARVTPSQSRTPLTARTTAETPTLVVTEGVGEAAIRSALQRVAIQHNTTFVIVVNDRSFLVAPDDASAERVLVYEQGGKRELKLVDSVDDALALLLAARQDED